MEDRVPNREQNTAGPRTQGADSICGFGATQQTKCFGLVSSNFSNLTQLEHTFKMRKNSVLKATDGT